MLSKWIPHLLFSIYMLCLTSCQQKTPTVNSTRTLRISCEQDFQTLDPRQVRNLQPVTAIHLLYEGLMNQQTDGLLVPALAETFTLSPDHKTYTFVLRDSHWSNGEAVTAYDFEQTWKSLLNPHIPFPNAYQLYAIKGAKEAKEGKISLEEVGIHAKDAHTLVVELSQPTPYFLNLITTHFYYPVHKSLYQQDPLISTPETDFITNGPFKVEKWSRHNELVTVNNPHYWDRTNVKLERIKLIVLDNSTALQLFQNGELDWVGSPIGTIPSDSLAYLKRQGELGIAPAASTYFFRCNTDAAPFDQVKIRQAFALALNRQDLVEHVLQGNQQPAFGFIPPSFAQADPFFLDHDALKARQLLQETLDEQGWTLKNFPKVTICYATGERAHKIAQVVQQQWNNILGITIDLQSCESKMSYEKLKNHDYQVSIGSWFADFRDPISFLEVFKSKDNGTNNTQWENVTYRNLLEKSSTLSDPQERLRVMKEAELILMQEMPIIPLFYSSFNYLKQPFVKGVYFSDLGYLDFKHAFIEHH